MTVDVQSKFRLSDMALKERSRFRGTKEELSSALGIQKPWSFKYIEDAASQPDIKALQGLRGTITNLYSLQSNFSFGIGSIRGAVAMTLDAKKRLELGQGA